MSATNAQHMLLAAAVNRRKKLELNECFDAINPASRPTAAQFEVLKDFGNISHQYVLAGNQSGKSQIGARTTAWIFLESHPFWKRPVEWANEPLLLIVMGRTTKQIEETLWKKISTFVNEEDVYIQRVGGVIQKVVHKHNKNTIIFLSHHNENEAREKVQSFVAHFVWLDEMPGNEKLVEECHRRVQARRGYFMSTFTPKVKVDAIRKMVDAVVLPYGKKYQFHMLDNPIYRPQDKERIMAELSSFSEDYRNTILCGDWVASDLAVYEYNSDRMVKLPVNYSRDWRHVESSDPALQSKFGFTLWAQCPESNYWYLVKACYIENIFVPDKVVDEVISLTKNYNIVRRVCDPHESWYLHTASSKGLTYVTPYNKNQRKGELIKGLQAALGYELFIAPWASEEFEDEIQNCQWKDRVKGTIVNSSKFHLLDTAQYFVDCKPQSVVKPEIKPWHQELREGNELRKKIEARNAAKNQINQRWTITARRNGMWRTKNWR